MKKAVNTVKNNFSTVVVITIVAALAAMFIYFIAAYGANYEVVTASNY